MNILCSLTYCYVYIAFEAWVTRSISDITLWDVVVVVARIKTATAASKSITLLYQWEKKPRETTEEMDGQCKGRYRSKEVDCTTSNGSDVGQKQMETSSSSLIIIEMMEESRRESCCCCCCCCTAAVVVVCCWQWQYNVDKEVIPVVIQCAVEEDGERLSLIPCV